MATYRINYRNAIFTGHPGELVITDPDVFMDAAVRSGMVTRLADPEPEPEKPEEVKPEVKKKK